MNTAITSKYRVGGILILAAAAFAGSRFIDARRTLVWPDWVRFLFGAALLFAVIWAVVVFHSILSPAHSDLSLKTSNDNRGPALRRGLLVAAAVFLLFAAMARALAAYAGVSEDRTFVAGLALFIGWCTVRKPWWFWDHWKAGLVRVLVGDRMATLLYLILASILLYAAVFGYSSQMFR